jgi:hypothetical protein
MQSYAVEKTRACSTALDRECPFRERACVSIPYLNVELILLSSFGVKFACARGTRVAPSQRSAATTNPSIVERVDLCCCPFHWQRALKPCRPWIGCIESTICWIAKEYERDCKRPLIYTPSTPQNPTFTTATASNT